MLNVELLFSILTSFLFRILMDPEVVDVEEVASAEVVDSVEVTAGPEALEEEAIGECREEVSCTKDFQFDNLFYFFFIFLVFRFQGRPWWFPRFSRRL